MYGEIQGSKTGLYIRALFNLKLRGVIRSMTSEVSKMSPTNEKEDSDEFPSDKFMKVYNNLPIEERQQTVIVLENQEGDEEPISWKMAKREIMEETDLGKKIAKKLEELEII